MSKTSKLCCICHLESGRYDDALKGPICPGCEQQKSYWTTNVLTLGKTCRRPSFSLEFEVVARKPAERRRALVLLQHQFTRTADRTVDDEYKSPIYQNIRVFRRPLAVLDELRDLVTERCGTHLHVTCGQTYQVRQARATIFGPLIAHLIHDEAQTEAFWGRTFCPQAQASLSGSDRHVSFNTFSRYPTIEYRLPRFRSAAQYLAVVRFCRETTAFLNWYFDGFDALRKTLPLPLEQVGTHILTRYQKAVSVFASMQLSGADGALYEKGE